MKKVDIVAKASMNALDAPASPQHSEGRPRYARKDHVDAINQMFAEFELAYHNQYHKAYAREGSVQLAKKYWLNRLSRFSPELLLRATRQVVDSQPYLPTLATIIEACENGMTFFGLPAPRAAYLEACHAPSPKADFDWSHPAVYLAGKWTGWFELSSLSESQILPLFEHHYRELVQRVLNGEALEVSMPAALPEKIERELSADENHERLRQLRETLKF